MTPDEAREQLNTALYKYNRASGTPGPEAATQLRHNRDKLLEAVVALCGDRGAAERYIDGLGKKAIDPDRLAREAGYPVEKPDKPATSKDKPTSPPAPPETPATATGDGPLGGRGDLPPGSGRIWLQGDLAAEVTPIESDLLTGMDKAIEQVNQAHFAVSAAYAWKPAGAQLPTGRSIPRLWDTAMSLVESQQRIQVAVDALREACRSDEPIIQRELEKPLKTLDSATEAIVLASQVSPRITEMGRGGAAMFAAFRAKLREQRRLIARAADERFTKGKDATSSVFAEVPPVQIALDGKDIAAAVLAVDAVTNALRPVPSMRPQFKAGGLPLVRGGGTPTGRAERYRGAPLGDPAKGPKPMSTPSPGKETPGGSPSKEKPSSKIDPNTLLQALQGAGQQPQQATPQQSQTPQMPTMPQTGQGQQNPLAQTTPQQQKQLADLLNGVKPEAEKKPDVDKPQFDSTPAGKAAEKDAPAPGSPIGTATPASPNGDPKTGEQPRKHQLDSTGTPVDRNKDGKVDKGAIPMSELTRRPFEMKLDVSPDLSIKLDDARLGEVMLNLEDGTPDDPKSVIEALREAGINVDELGDEVDPKDIREGDTVVSEMGSGMYIGDDKVLMGTGEVKPLQELLDANGKVYETPLPDLPKEVDLTQDQRDALTAHDNGQARPNDQHQVPAVDPATGKPIGEQGAVGGDQPAKPAGDGGQGGGQQPPQGQQELGEDGKPKPPPGAPAPGEPGGPAAGEQPSTPPAQPTQTDTAANPDSSGGSQPGAGQPAQQPNAPVAGPPPSSAYVPQGDDAKVQPQQPAAEQPKEGDGPQQRPFRGYAVG